MSIVLPATLPIDFNGSSKSITLPLKLPFSFGKTDGTIKLPATLPLSFSSSTGTVKLPVTLPLRFKASDGIERTILLPYTEHIDLGEIHGIYNIPYYETSVGKVTSIPYHETAWFFPGLILSENIITERNAQVTVSENVQSLILADFELLSTNSVKISWYGNTTPGVIVKKKTYSDEEYKIDGTYTWGTGSAVIDITNEDYNIYLEGTANSGSSAVYTISGVDSKLVVPSMGVILNNKLYIETIEYTSTYTLEINY